MSSLSFLAEALAAAFLAGDWHVRAMMARGAWACAEPPLQQPRGGGFFLALRDREVCSEARHAWIRELAFSARTRWPEAPLHEVEALVHHLETNPRLEAAWTLGLVSASPRLLGWTPRAAPARWPVPPLHTLREVGDWLGLDEGLLAWLADRKGLLSRAEDPRLQHYRRRWVPRDGRVPRLLEAPKQRLKAVQRKILDELLALVPAHDAAHGFVAGRSVKTHASLHLGRAVVVRVDLRSFFTWVQPGRVLGLFRALGYSEAVSQTLLGLCTTRTPEAALRLAPRPAPVGGLFELQRKLRSRHLPQGSPTSPALANLTAFSLDARLQGWAAWLGARYSRYADDLVFSGDEGLSVGALVRGVEEICAGEGFEVNRAKTRVMRAQRRQEITGLCVNAGLGVPRAERKMLEAQLYNLARGTGARTRGLRAELEGRVGWVEHVNLAQGRRLRELLAQIHW